MSDLVSLKQRDGSEIQVGLADLANINMDDIEEVRGGALPQGNFLFEISGCQMEIIENKDGDKRLAVPVKLKVLNVGALASSRWMEIPTDADDLQKLKDGLVGREYTETFFIGQDVDFGRVKAFLVDTGYKASGTVQEVLAGAVGTRFYAPIKHSKNKDDADKFYTNIQRDKIVPYTG